jgi:hypothetical protein
MSTIIERRRFRRAELDVTAVLRSLTDEASAAEPIIGQVKDVSLAGVLCHVKAPCPLTPGEQVLCSITVPPEQARLFPFTRLHGKGWVVRIEAIPVGRREGERPPEDELIGLAVAFTPDVTALSAIEFT